VLCKLVLWCTFHETRLIALRFINIFPPSDLDGLAHSLVIRIVFIVAKLQVYAENIEDIAAGVLIPFLSFFESNVVRGGKQVSRSTERRYKNQGSCHMS
jgi:hypothetical protein